MRTLTLLSLLALVAAPGPSGQAESMGTVEPPPDPAPWAQFRGPQRSGISAESGILREWPADGPEILWRKKLGEGFSGISVAGDRLFTLFAEGEEEFLGSFRTTDGGEAWRVRLGGKFHEPFGNGPRSTPTVDGDSVYALGAKGRLVAAGIADGAVRWQVELSERYPITEAQTINPMAAVDGPQLPLYGYSGSPLVEGDLLIVETGAKNGRSLVAFDKATGDERWTALDDEISYSSPIAVTLHGERQIIALPGSSIVSLSPAGEVNWRHPWALNPSQPVFIPPDKLFVSTINGVGAMLLEIADAGGEPDLEELWKIPRLKNAWNSSIAYDGHLYGFDNATLRCVAIATGELQWAARGLGQGTLILADGVLIALSDRGKLALVESSPEGYVALAEAQILEGRTWTSPSLSDGILYLRNHDEMVAVDLRTRK